MSTGYSQNHPSLQGMVLTVTSMSLDKFVRKKMSVSSSLTVCFQNFTKGQNYLPKLFAKIKFSGAISNLKYNYKCLYLPQFLTDFGQILDSKSYDQA